MRQNNLQHNNNNILKIIYYYYYLIMDVHIIVPAGGQPSVLDLFYHIIHVLVP